MQTPQNELRLNRSQCVVARDKQILMVTHEKNGQRWLCLPGGAIDEIETPEEAALRELNEECQVQGVILKKTSEYVDPYTGGQPSLRTT